MANTVEKIKDLYVAFNPVTNTWDEVADTDADKLNFITTATDINVTDESNNVQEYRVVFSDQKQRPKTNYISYTLEYFIKTNLGAYILDRTEQIAVTANNYVDITDPVSPIWLVGSDAFEDDLTKEILDDEGNSYEPQKYEQKLKDNVLTESNYFVKTFGIPVTGQFGLQYATILNQASIKLS
jgi:hypothetical protein